MHLQDILQEVCDAGGCVIALTSEPQRYADQARQLRSLTYPVYGDPAHTVAHYLIETNILPNLCITTNESGLWYKKHPFMKKYVHGVAHPAVAVLQRAGLDRPVHVAYSMAVQPHMTNGFGAVGRPNARQMWNKFKSECLLNGRNLKKMDGSSFRAERLYDERYIRAVLTGIVSVTLLALGLYNGSQPVVVAGVVAAVVAAYMGGTSAPVHPYESRL